MDAIADTEQNYEGAPHKSSFLPIQENREHEAGISNQAWLDGIQESEEGEVGEVEESGIPNRGTLSGDSWDTDRRSADTSDTSPNTRNGSTPNPNSLQQRGSVEHDEQENVELPQQSTLEGPEHSGLNHRAHSNLGFRRRQDTDLTELGDCQNVEEKATGFLPCHYFDYIAGTSTGGLVLKFSPTKLCSSLN